MRVPVVILPPWMVASWVLRSTATAALAAMVLLRPMLIPATDASAVASPTACTRSADFTVRSVESLPRMRAMLELQLSAMATFRVPEEAPMLLLTDTDSAFALLPLSSLPAVTLMLAASTSTPVASRMALFFAPRRA